MNATHFIKAEKNGKLSVTKEAQNLLTKIKNPVAIISIAGLARTGKSFILNKIVESMTKSKSSGGFKIGNTIDSCTKGIWIWGIPIEAKVRGENATILLLDTEGLASLDESQTHDAKIFTLSILLSSLFVYNSMGTIDSNALDRLSLVCELTKHIQLQTHHKTTEEDISKIAPSFIWLLRDFSLELEHQGQEINSNEYLELALKLQKDLKRESKVQNVKKSIQNLFPNRDCCTLVRPVNDEKKIRKIETLSSSDFRPEFKEQIHDFLGLIGKRIKVKEFNNQSINGSMLYELTKSYVDSINEGKIPNVAGAWESMVEIQCRRSYDESKVIFENLMKKKKFTEIEDLERYYNHCLSESLKSFDNSSIGDLSKSFRSKFQQESLSLFETIKKELEYESKAICQKLIQEMSGRLMMKNFKSFNELKSIFKQEKEVYFKNAKGPSQLSFYQHFIETDLLNILQRMIESKEETFEQQKKSFESMIEKLKKEIESKTLELNNQKYEMKNAQKSHENQLKEINQHKIEVKQLSAQIQKLENELGKSKQQLFDEKDKNNRIQTSTHNLEKETKNLHAKYQKEIKEIEKEKTKEIDDLKAQVLNYSNLYTSSKKDNSMVEKQLSSLKAENQKLKLLETLEPENKQLKEKSKNQKKLIDQNEKQLENLKEELEKLKKEIDLLKWEREKSNDEYVTLQDENNKLKKQIESSEFQVPTKTPKKTKRLRDDMEEDEIPSFSEDTMVTPTKKPRQSMGNLDKISYTSMSPMLLKSKLKERGIPTPKKTNKKDLIKVLEEHDKKQNQ
eukprot:gene1416-12036_t